jgi:putative membrane-bound dehydrogenase-like protein
MTAVSRLKVARGMAVSPWATEPMVRDITSLSFDGAGRAYVVETGRRRTSVFDVRGLGAWLEDDFAFRSTGDRQDFLRRVLDPADPRYSAFVAAVTKAGKGGFQDFNRDGIIDWNDLEVESERVRLLTDTDGDGRADRVETFVDDFRSPIGGVAAGVLVEGEHVWFSSIPDLWRFDAGDRRFSGAGPASPELRAAKESHRILTGFGVHIAFGGHDLHGLTLGPDGRLYFSIADRGTSVTNREGLRISLPDTGAVFRCEPDGSRMEVYASGLRNPQELAFDDLGRLWTGDNNGDGGDKARWTLVLEGADYGWTLGWQWLPKMGAWNSERLWHLRDGNSAAYLVPPVAHVGHGPAGIAHYPGTGLGDRFRGHFFYADFPGGVRTFQVEPQGAFFRVAQAGPWMEDNSSTNRIGKLLWDLSPVDVTFPPFGGVVVADWVQGWDKTGKGRLWHVTDPALSGDRMIAEVRRWLAEGPRAVDTSGLVGRLDHPDQRVRLSAQRELARRGSSSMRPLLRTASNAGTRLARIHAIWAMGQIVRSDPALKGGDKLRSLRPLLKDRDPEIRAQVLRLLSEADDRGWIRGLASHLSDAEAVVRVAALEAVRRIQEKGAQLAPETAWAVASLAAGEHEPDPAEFHALTRAVPVVESFHYLGEDPPAGWTPSPSRIGHGRELASSPYADRLRLALLIRLRREGDPEVARFLGSSNAVLALEAARAVNDVPISSGFPALAALLPENVPALPRDGEERLGGVRLKREEARGWILRRAVNAAFRLGEASGAAAIGSLGADANRPEALRIEAIEALADWGRPPSRDRIVGLYRPLAPRDPEPALAAMEAIWMAMESPATPAAVAVAAVRAAERLQPPRLRDLLRRTASSPFAEVRKEAARVEAAVRKESWESLLSSLETGSVRERRAAFGRLASTGNPELPSVVEKWIRKVAAGDVESTLQADILDLARLPGLPSTVGEALAAWKRGLPETDPLAAFRPALEGGDPENGRRLFAERADWGCQRCHKLGGVGGDVGPELAGLGRKRGREHLLRSILQPGAEIATGYESVVVGTSDGGTIAGMLRSETPEALVILTGDEGPVSILKSRVVSRERAPSAMPEGLGELMTLREIRDVVEALLD